MTHYDTKCKAVVNLFDQWINWIALTFNVSTVKANCGQR